MDRLFSLKFVSVILCYQIGINNNNFAIYGNNNSYLPLAGLSFFFSKISFKNIGRYLNLKFHILLLKRGVALPLTAHDDGN